jgi:hypothetical protein
MSIRDMNLYTRVALLAVASRGTGPERPVICLPCTTTPQRNPCKPCRRGHTRHSQEAIRGPGNRVSRRQACGTYRKAASIQPSIAKSPHQRTPGLRGPIHPSPQSHLPSWALIFSLLAAKPDTARLRMAVDRACRNDVALSCESFAVH